ncbi:MAG: hypothetical protein ABSH33_12540 [Steroidobacteraceae bacterium]|jgi:hypothetical protein
MSSERPEEFSEPPVNRGGQTTDASRTSSDAKRASETAGAREPADDASHHEATTVLVRGETIRGQEPKPSSKDRENSPRKEVSEAKIKMQGRLPALDDDADVGVRKDHIVIRDGKADLAFAGTLLASAAPPSAPTGQWHEYRIYETSGGKHVFSKVTRSVYAEQPDTHEADVFDPSPSSVPSQLLRSARDLARSRPMTWMDAAVAFFGYDPLAKALYRKLSGQFEEHIS